MNLRSETIGVLATAKRPTPPFFPNVIVAELFEAKHTRGPIKVLPRTTGGYVVFDTRAPLGEGVLEDGLATEADAHAALERRVALLAKPTAMRRRAA